MGGSLEDIALEALSAIVGHGDANEFLINRLVNAGRTRPHPWSTRYDYICWSGLTDRSYNSRLLPPKAYPLAEAVGTRRPPLAEVSELFQAAPTGQRICPKSTCLFPAFAQYLTDGFIRTRINNDPAKDDRRRSTSNHEIDLSPLYGRDELQTSLLRLDPVASGLKGRLATQPINGEEFPLFLFSGNIVDPRFCDAAGQSILDLPLGLDGAGDKASLFAVGGDRANATPQVSMINTLFLREHNRLAAHIEQENPTWDDERVFQIARNITIVMFIRIVIEEYINHINTSVFRFIFDSSVAWHAKWNKQNWMTAEFSLLYRWHSLIPQSFTWNDALIDGKDLLLDNRRLIAGGLSDAFVAASSNRASRLGLGNTADFVQKFEERAVAQARLNNLASYNDYRVAMGKNPAKSFAEVVGKTKDTAEKSRRAKVAAELQRLYGTVDNLEFYVGLFAEPPEKNGPLPDLILAMVAMDAFSQALTNPLLSEHVWGNKVNRRLAFTDFGLGEIETTRRLKDVLVRNAKGLDDRFVGMTRADWHRD